MRAGSTRNIVSVGAGEIGMRYTDAWSAFDRGPSPQTIRLLGETRKRCAWASFLLARMARIPHHFIGVGDGMLVVREFTVTDENGNELPLISGKSHGTMIPLEWIYRVEVDGSLFDRLVSGEVPRANYGIPDDAEIVRGMPLPKMEIECTTKREAVDRHVSNEEARDIAKLSMPEWMEAVMIVTEVASAISLGYRGAGFRVPDGKIELALDLDGKVVVVDTFGTQDENRIIELSTGDLYSKDIIRNYLKGLPFYAQLREAKKEYPNKKEYWPQYPLLPEEFVEKVTSAYAEVTIRYEQYVRRILK